VVVHNLPHAAAPFVNRVSEIAEITHQLHDANCRLLTLVGPGGIGKTRLAIRGRLTVLINLTMAFTLSRFNI
jgi:hypothetical protein